MSDRASSVTVAEKQYRKPCYDEELCDMEFVVEGKTIPVGKSVLGMKSKVFKAMLTGNFKGKTQTSSIEMPEKVYEEFLEFMEFLHLFEKMQFSDNNIVSLYNLAQEYDVEGLCEKCLEFIQTRPNQRQLQVFDLCNRSDKVKDIIRSAELSLMLPELTSRDFLDTLSPETVRDVLVALNPYLKFVRRLTDEFDISVKQKELLRPNHNPQVDSSFEECPSKDHSSYICDRPQAAESKIYCNECYSKIRNATKIVLDGNY